MFGFIKNGLARSNRIVFLLIGGIFKEPLLFLIGLFGVFTFLKITLSIFEDWSTLLDPVVTLSEMFSALTGYLFFIKKNFVAWLKQRELTSAVELKLEHIAGKLQQISFHLRWTNKDSEKIASFLFPKWIKTEEFETVEGDFVAAVDFYILSGEGLSKGQRLFLQYISYEIFPLSRSGFLGKLQFSDITHGSPINEFLSLFNTAERSKEQFDVRVTGPSLELNKAKEIFGRVCGGNLGFYRDRIKDSDDREALVAIAEQCIREGYTPIEQILKFRRERQPFKMLIKYDERFTFFERSLKALALKQYTEKKASNLVQKAGVFLKPLPFSRALQEYSSILIRLLPRDYFVFVFDLNRMKTEFNIRDAAKFMERFVVPKAKEHHESLLTAIRKIDDVFKPIKKPFTANFYIIDIDIETLVADADNKAIPEGMKRILLGDILNAGDFAQLLSSQDLYLRQVIESMPLDALLFKAVVDQPVKNFLRNQKLKIHRNLKAAGIAYATIRDKEAFSKKINRVTDAIYRAKDGKQAQSISMTKAEIQQAVEAIANNSSKLVRILDDGITLK